MNKVEQLHADALFDGCYGMSHTKPNDRPDSLSGVAAKVTEQVAIEFAEWVSKYDWVFMFDKNYWVNDDLSKYPKTTKELFQEFLKTKQ